MDRRAWLFLLGAYLLSVALRAPDIGRPLSRHHEFCTAVVLIILENWQGDGFQRHQGVPALNFDRPADHHIHPASYGFAARDGVFHYLSHPPLAYDLPYWILRLLGVAPGPLAITLFNLLGQALTVCMLWLVLVRIAPTPGILGIPLAPAVAASTYLFMPAPLWFHANAYMADMFVQVPWALHLFVAMRVLGRGAPPGRLLLATYGITLGLTVYTNWLGLSVALVEGAIILRRFRTHVRSRTMLLGVTALAVLLPLLLMFMRYTRELAPQDVLTYLLYRFQQRGTVSLEDHGGLLVHLGRLAHNYLLSWAPLLVALPIMALLVGVKRLREAFRTGTASIFLVLTGAPVLLDHALLLKYAEHDFATLKAGYFLCGALGLLLAQGWGHWQRPSRIAALVLLGSTLLAGARMYRVLNHVPPEVAHRWNEPIRIGTVIAGEASPDEVVFVRGFEPEPQVQWYARRNILRVSDVMEARAFLAAHQHTRGIIFSLGPDSLRMERITRP